MSLVLSFQKGKEKMNEWIRSEIFPFLRLPSATCEIRNPRSHQEGGKLTWQNLPNFSFFVSFFPLSSESVAGGKV